ncbi:DUF4178 domain-containing protein [Micromonospora costi]|uniref:DUF4178 domain-containing protein n=1 Tax=Micromonospora costi TaxID=1530042 RepID=A0A3B0AF63_9ACTN|nr:DUF4178 domain-containing protein [Micromonospora costi]RKN58964.1 DUF4178 domain-containing protein [Micromonospora costi]
MSGWVAYLAVAGLIVLLAIVGAVLRRFGSRPRAGTGPGASLAGDEALRAIRPGDVVEIRGVPWPVRGTIRLHEAGWSWAEHLLDDVDGVRRWLSVEERRDHEVVLWTAEPGATVTPGAPTIDLADHRYGWVESGQARYTATGTTGREPSGTMRYHDYQAPGGARLSFEAYGEAGWEVARGELLRRAEVVVRPRTGAN